MESSSQQFEPSSANVRRKPAHAARRFTTTRWSLVLQASAPDGRRALSELCSIYWAPVHAFIRSHGVSAEDAADVTQDFFASLLAKNEFAHADRERGRFRSLLRSYARNHLFNWFERRNALKRGGRIAHVSIECQQDTALPGNLVDEHHAEREYDRRWAMTLVERALTQLRQRYERRQKEALFDVLYAGLSGSASEQNDREFARALGKSENVVRAERCRLRKLFEKCLKREVAQTLVNPDEVDDELRRLLEALS